MQATIVALYGDKPEHLHTFLTDCQDSVTQVLGSRFRKYDIDQIHATVVGLEREALHSNCFLNRNFKTHRQEQVQMELAGLLNFFREGGHVPFQLQIGGFADRDYPFSSRDTRPFNRGFSIQGGNVVVMGWPVCSRAPQDAPSSSIASIHEARLYPNTLDSIRRGAQRYGVLHSYHKKPADTDNDFFFRIGMIDAPESVEPLLKSRVQAAMRSFLGSLRPLTLSIKLSDLQIVFYESEELPLDTSVAYSLDTEDLDGAFMQGMYRGNKNAQ